MDNAAGVVKYAGTVFTISGDALKTGDSYHSPDHTPVL